MSRSALWYGPASTSPTPHRHVRLRHAFLDGREAGGDGAGQVLQEERGLGLGVGAVDGPERFCLLEDSAPSISSTLVPGAG